MTHGLGVRGAAALGIAFVMGACSAEVKGPAPAVEPPSAEASPPPVDPEIICRDQLRTTVTLHGENFSPIPIDIPDAPKTALPDVLLTRSHDLDGGEVGEPEQTLWSGDPDADPTNAFDADGEPLLSWASRQEMSIVVNQDLILGLPDPEMPVEEGEDDPRDRGVLAEGVWDVQVQNANGETIDSLQSLAVVKKPEVEELTPGIVCLDQGARSITLDGQRFLRNESDEAVLEIEGASAPFPMTLSECTTIDHAGLDAEVCDRVEVELGQGSLEDGFPGLVVQNPETAACNSEEDIKLRVVPPPSIDRVAPPMGCVAEGSRTFVIEGQDFLRIDGTDPQVTVGSTDFSVDEMGGCEDLDTQGHEVERCSSITITVGQDVLAPDLYEVTVVNPDPAGCDASASGVLRIVPPPSVANVAPPLVCLDDGARDVTVTGSDFLVVDGEKPAVVVDGATIATDAVAPDGCADLEVDGLTVQQCDTLVVTLAVGEVGVGMPDVTITNPDPAGCSASRNDLLTVVEGPVIDSATPVLVCTVDADKAIEIKGSGFLKVGDALPAVSVGGAAVKSVDGVAGCAEITVNGLSVEQCDTITATVAMGALSTGRPVVAVTNPDPAGCAASRDDVLAVPPALTVATLDPVNVCEGTTGSLPITLTGTGWLRVGSDDFDLSFGGASVTPDGITDCTELAVAGDDTVLSCDGLTATLTLTATQTMTGGTTLPISITNDHVPGCALTQSIDLTVVSPPTVSGIDIVGADVDDQVCSEQSLTLTITGTGFVAGATVTFENDNTSVTADSVTVDSDTQLTATFDMGLPFDDMDSDFDLIVANAGNCAGDPVVDAINVNPTPLVFFVDPPVVYNGRPIDITVFSSGLSDSSVLDRIELVDDGDNVTILCDTAAGGANPDCQSIRRNRNVARVDAGFTAGDYALRVTSALGCEGELPGGLSITENLALTVDSVEPAYVSGTEPTAVVINGAGFSTTGGLPRVYLTPFTAGDSAQALSAVEFQSPTRLTGVVPAGLAPEDYDVIVVNANGEVGLLPGDDPDAIHVTGNEPPIVTQITPSTIDESPENLVLTGDHFDNTGDALTVDFDCTDGVSITEQASGTVNTVTATSIDLTLTHTLSNDLICEVTVTNADGASFTYASISVKNSSGNLATFATSSSTMTVPRRALGLVAARPTATSRFLYAMGGDDGTFLGAMSSVESIGVGVDGQLVGDWAVQRPQGNLPEARTNMGFTRIDRFIYLTGGHDGTVDTGMGETNGATDTVYRAQVLDPLAGPEVEDLDANLGDDAGTTGLGGGLWQYRIAATFPSDDPNNPDGESMAGEVLNVQLPDLSLQGDSRRIVLTLEWDPVPGADGYRIYRSPTVVDPSMDAVSELLFDLDCSTPATPNLSNCTCEGQLSCEDDGTTSTNAAETPLPAGSLGMWHEVLPLATEREGHFTAALKHPNPALTSTGGMPSENYETWVLYAVGGRDNNSPSVNYLSDYEWVEVRVFEDGHQELQDAGGGTWTSVASSIGTGRADLAGWVLTPTDSSFIPADTAYLAIGTGFTDDSNTTVAEVRAGYLDAMSSDGQLEADVAAPVLDPWSGNRSRGASCFGDASGRVYLFGGEDSGGGLQGDVAAALQSGPDTASSWSAGGGGVLNPRRSYCAAAQESAFFFIAGGVAQGAPDAVTDTIQTTVE